MKTYTDIRYKYGRQVSKWVDSMASLQGIMSSTARYVVRRDGRDRHAVFTYKPCTPKQRYQLEVVLRCRVVKSQVEPSD